MWSFVTLSKKPDTVHRHPVHGYPVHGPVVHKHCDKTLLVKAIDSKLKNYTILINNFKSAIIQH